MSNNNGVTFTELKPVLRDIVPAQLTEATYSNVLQGKAIHGLMSSSTNGIQMDMIQHVGTMTSDDVLITIDEEAIQDISSQTFKVLVILLDAVTAQLPHGDYITAEAINKGRIVRIPLKKYMEACKIKDKKEARAQLNTAINALYAISLEWDETVYEIPEGKTRRVKVPMHNRMRIAGRTSTPQDKAGTPVVNGVAEFRFDYDMAEYLSNAYIMPYPKALLSINTHYHPYSIPLGWKLCALHNMNYGTPRENKTTVKTLLAAAKGIPRYEKIAAKGEIYRRIIERFDRDMAALVPDVLSEYWYYDGSGTRIDSQQLGTLSYTEFSALNIHYELKNYPDQTKRIEAQEKRIKSASSHARRKEEDQNGSEA